MPSNKDRLYVGLHVRAGKPNMPSLEGTYHWALIVGPKKQTADSRWYCFHAKETLSFAGDPPRPTSVWHYASEVHGSAMDPASIVLVRIVVGKVKSMGALRSVFEKTPLRPDSEGWNCVGWVQEVLLAAVQDGKALRTAARDWQPARDAAMRYVEQEKTAHRLDSTVQYDPSKIATWDLLQGVELVP